MSLGTWQLHRKVEKEDLLKIITLNQQKPAQNVDTLKTPESYRLLAAEGHFLPEKTIYLQSKVHKGKNGVYVLDVFQTLKGQFLLIQRGWAEREIRSHPTETLKIEGIARFPSPPTYFQPSNTPPTYFWIDLKALSQDFSIPLLPYYMVARFSFDSQIERVDSIPFPRNNHLQYAITWYSLAFVIGFMLLLKRYFMEKRKSCDSSYNNT